MLDTRLKGAANFQSQKIIFFLWLLFGLVALTSTPDLIADGVEGVSPSFYRYKINSSIGMGLYRGSGISFGEQLGFSLIEKERLYVGPDLNFTFFSPQSLFTVMGGGWYEFPLKESLNLNLAIGVLGGVGFLKEEDGLTNSLSCVFLDFAVSEELDDLVAIRAQLRPGMLGKDLSVWMALNISFRFQ